MFYFVSALLHLHHLPSLHKSLFYPTFVYILYDKCCEDVRGESSSAKYKMRNYETLEKFPGLKLCVFKKFHHIFSFNDLG